METKRTCQHCGKTLGSEAIEGLCPECLMKMGLGIGTEATGPAPQGKRAFVPPTIAELGPRFPHFEILALIGHGGMGAVYKARQKQLERVVALKILPDGSGKDLGFADRFAREAKAMARLNHPGIVTIHDFGCADGLYYLVMEFVDGVSLGQLMSTGRVSPREALAIVPQICDALQYAHDQGIVHRDIKPENILLDRQGRVKVADFGLAKLVGTLDEPQAEGPTAESTALTRAGKTMGTPSYMAPEQVGDPGAVDHRADIYALGVVFYQMLTGELPSKPIEAPSRKVRIDVRLDEVVLCALEKTPERRYQQVSHIKTAVETIAQTSTEDEPKSEPGPSWRPRAGATVRGGKARILVAIVALLVFGFVSLMVTKARHARQAEIAARTAETTTRLTPIPVSAAIVRRGNIGVYINSVGSVESSNSVVFTIPEDVVQEVVKKFDDARAPQNDKSALGFDWYMGNALMKGASLTIEAYDRSFKKRLGQGSLTTLDNQIDQSTGTLKCKASLFTDGNTLIIPGMFLNIRLFLGTKHGVSLVPIEAILNDQQSTFVWKIESDDRVSRCEVAVGIKEGGEAEIARGLSPGEQVIIGAEDAKVIREGQKVRCNIVPTAEPALGSQLERNQPSQVPEWFNIKPLADWITDLRNSDPKIQKLASEAIAAMGTNGLPEFLKILSEKEPTAEDRDRHYQTAEALRFIGPGLKSAIPDFTALLKSSDEETAYSGATALAFSASVVPEAFGPLTNGLVDPEARVRDAATHGVGLLFNLDPPSTHLAEPALPIVLSNLKDKIDYVRADTAASLYLYAYRQHLENHDAKPGMIVPPLTDLLQDRYPWARIHAAMALGEYGTNANSAVSGLSNLLMDTDPQVRSAATNALRRISPPGTLATPSPQPGIGFYLVGGGGVAIPGRRVFQPGLTAMAAIKACGGFTAGALKTKAELTHTGSAAPLVIDLAAIEQGNAPDPKLMPGDKLWIPAPPPTGL